MSEPQPTPLFIEADTSTIISEAISIEPTLVRRDLDPSALHDERWSWATHLYNNVSVNNQAGVRLLDGGTPLRAQNIDLEIADCRWTYAINSPVITSPHGNGQQAPNGWLAPLMLQFGVLLIAPTGYSRIDPGRINRSIQKPNDDILFNVNDKLGTYGDNGGSYDIWMRINS